LRISFSRRNIRRKSPVLEGVNENVPDEGETDVVVVNVLE